MPRIGPPTIVLAQEASAGASIVELWAGYGDIRYQRGEVQSRNDALSSLFMRFFGGQTDKGALQAVAARLEVFLLGHSDQKSSSSTVCSVPLNSNPTAARVRVQGSCLAQSTYRSAGQRALRSKRPTQLSKSGEPPASPSQKIGRGTCRLRKQGALNLVQDAQPGEPCKRRSRTAPPLWRRPLDLSRVPLNTTAWSG